MGASLGLLAFMLAFSFAVAQKHYEERTNAYLLEVTAIDAAYRGASLLDQKSGSEARGLLRQFVQLRRDTSDAEDRDELEEVVMLIRDAERVQHTMFNRISPIIWLTLLAMSFLSMIIMGYQAGLTGKRSFLATWTLAITFASVLTLVADLDRPQMRLFKMNQSLMVELQNRINSEAPPYVEPAPN